MSVLTIGSLFSGIGGLELGLEWAGLGPVLWQVEIDAGARAVLAAHWPEVTRHEDVRAVGAATLAAVDVICGGFPCQDVSSAGKRAGLRGARSGLWFEFRRVVSELRPEWVVVENVASGAHAWVSEVAEGLGQLGYAVLPVPLAAADCGAPHLRRRIFLVAHADRAVVRLEQGRSSGSGRRGARKSTDVGEARRLATDAHASAEHAGAVDAEVAVASAAADAHASRREGRSTEASQGWTGPAERGWRTPQPDILRVVHGVSKGLDERNARPRIAALGNAVVPQCAEVVGHIIRQLMEVA